MLNKPSLNELQERAKVATYITLESRPRLPPTVPITLGTRWEDTCIVFELYVAQERPQDAIVLTRARVNIFDGRIEAMNVFDEAIGKVLAEASK